MHLPQNGAIGFEPEPNWWTLGVEGSVKEVAGSILAGLLLWDVLVLQNDGCGSKPMGSHFGVGAPPF